MGRSQDCKRKSLRDKKGNIMPRSCEICQKEGIKCKCTKEQKLTWFIHNYRDLIEKKRFDQYELIKRNELIES